MTRIEHKKMLGAVLCSAMGSVLAVSAVAQTTPPSTDTTAPTHRIVLPLPKQSETTVANKTSVSAPDQAAGQAAVAALMREMAALRDTTSTTHVATPRSAVAGPSSKPATMASNDTSILSPRTTANNDVLGNLAPPSAVASVPDTVASTPVQAAQVTAQAPMVLARGGARPMAAQPGTQPAVAPRAAALAAATPPASVPALAPAPMIPSVASAPMANTEMMGNFNSTEASEKAMHVTVGRTIFIDTRRRLTRVYVTDPTVLNSYTANPNQIVVTALKPGASTVLVWDESGETQAYLISSDMNVESLQHALTQGFPQDAIHAEGNEDRVVLSGYVGTEDNAINAGKLSAQFTKNVTNSLVVNSSRVKQVRLKVRIIEVDRSKLAQFGFNFFSAGSKNFTVGSTSTGQFSSTVTGNSTSATIGNPLNFSLYSSKLNIGMTLEDLATQNIAQILAEPTITSMSGQKASFLAGGQFPFPVVQASSSGAASVTLQFQPYGVKLDFTPKVNPDGTIDLKVNPEVSALDYSNAVTIAGYTVPAISTRKADTELVLESGQSFAISGLLDQRITDVMEHAPGIASVPILGELFKSKSLNHSIGELIVIVTPTLVDPIAEAKAEELATPAMVVPFLKKDKFDNELPKYEKKQQ